MVRLVRIQWWELISIKCCRGKCSIENICKHKLAAGVMGALLVSKVLFGKSDLTMALNGAIV